MGQQGLDLQVAGAIGQREVRGDHVERHPAIGDPDADGGAGLHPAARQAHQRGGLERPAREHGIADTAPPMETGHDEGGVEAELLAQIHHGVGTHGGAQHLLQRHHIGSDLGDDRPGGTRVGAGRVRSGRSTDGRCR